LYSETIVTLSLSYVGRLYSETIVTLSLSYVGRLYNETCFLDISHKAFCYV